MQIQRTHGAIREILRAAVLLAAAALVIHWAWRTVAPAVTWLAEPTFGQTVALVAGIVVVGGLLLRRRHRPEAPKRRHAAVAP